MLFLVHCPDIETYKPSSNNPPMQLKKEPIKNIFGPIWVVFVRNESLSTFPSDCAHRFPVRGFFLIENGPQDGRVMDIRKFDVRFRYLLQGFGPQDHHHRIQLEKSCPKMALASQIAHKDRPTMPIRKILGVVGVVAIVVVLVLVLYLSTPNYT